MFCCAADNDLYRVMTAGGRSYARFESPEEAGGMSAESSTMAHPPPHGAPFEPPVHR